MHCTVARSVVTLGLFYNILYIVFTSSVAKTNRRYFYISAIFRYDRKTISDNDDEIH